VGASTSGGVEPVSEELEGQVGLGIALVFALHYYYQYFNHILIHHHFN
jgi:hypothetical protein